MPNGRAKERERWHSCYRFFLIFTNMENCGVILHPSLADLSLGAEFRFSGR